ncbi:MAG TPA: DUF4398 domain-containing protein [Gallionellaceae bacterium]|nr:DUF4398 domain-containing protein [Gallionellaceae bacterium]
MIQKISQLKSNQMIHSIGLSVAVAIFMAGCASTPAPIEQMAVSREAVSNASSAGGNEFAPVQLNAAIEKMDAAERAMVKKDYLRARQLAEQAEADAQLAGAMARSAKAKKAADELQEGSRILRQEIERKAD